MFESVACSRVRARHGGTAGNPVVIGAGLAFCVLGGLATGLGVAPLPFAAALGVSMLVLWFFTWRQGLLVAFGIFVCLQPLAISNLRLLVPELTRPVRLIDEFWILLMVLLVGAEILIRGQSVVRPRLYGLLSLIVGIGVVASLLNRVPLWIASFDLFLMFKVFLLFLIGAHLRFSSSEFARFWKILTYWGIILLAVGVLEIVSHPWLAERLHNTSFADVRWGFPNAKSLFIHPGAFGFFMATMTLMNVGLYAVTKRARYAHLAALFAIGIVMSGRLKPLVGVPVAIVIVGLLTKRITLRQMTFAVFPLLLFLSIFGAQVLERGRGKLSLGRFGDLEGAAPRAVLYVTSIRIARDEFPFGAGLGRFGGEISRRYYSPVYAQYGISGLAGFGQRGDEDAVSFIQDAGWAYYLGELGVLGLITVFSVLGYILLELFRIAAHARSLLLSGLGLGATMVLVEAMLESVASPVLQTSFQAFFALGIAGAVYSRWRDEQAHPPQTASIEPPSGAQR